MIERDDNIPPLNELLGELEHARRIAENHFKDAPLIKKTMPLKLPNKISKK